MKLKIKRGDLENTIAKGLEQTAPYMDKCGNICEGHFILFNRDNRVKWEDKIWHREEQHGNYIIEVWGM